MSRVLKMSCICLLSLLSHNLYAAVGFQGTVDHTRFDNVEGVVMAEPETIWLTESAEILDEAGAATTLVDLEGRQLSAGQQLSLIHI